MIRVLIAEDFELLREDLAETLSAQPDFEFVGSAATGAGIVALAKKTPCDMILMDIEMERLNAGILAAEEIRDFAPAIKIIFLTAHETHQMILTAMSTGAVDYVIKGCPDEELLLHLRNACEGHPMLDAAIQETVMEEYTRLRRSERSLLFFINNVSQLTAAERQLVKLLLAEKKVKEIAELRCVELVTVKTQINSLLRKFGCTRTKEIVEMIQELNISHLF